MRFPVQWVNRPDLNFRGLSGTIESGTMTVGEAVRLQPSGLGSHISRITLGGADLQTASAGDAITVLLADQVDAGRGEVLTGIGDDPDMADQVSAYLIWMGDEPLIPGRKYVLRTGTQSTLATVDGLKHKIDFETMSEMPASTLEANDIAIGDVATESQIVFDPFEINPSTGSFILIDRYTNATVAAGLIRFGLRRATNVRWQALDIDKSARSRLKGQKPCCLWFTGLSGAGKSTVANLLEKRLHAAGHHTYLLDGDNVRHGLNRDLGFTEADRVENIRRIAHVADLMVDSGLITLVSFISPFASDRQMARELMQDGEFIEVYVATSLEACEARDLKGLYRKARAGEIPNFTGISSPYEPPENPDITIDGADGEPEELAERIYRYLLDLGYGVLRLRPAALGGIDPGPRVLSTPESVNRCAMPGSEPVARPVARQGSRSSSLKLEELSRFPLKAQSRSLLRCRITLCF